MPSAAEFDNASRGRGQGARALRAAGDRARRRGGAADRRASRRGRVGARVLVGAPDDPGRPRGDHDRRRDRAASEARGPADHDPARLPGLGLVPPRRRVPLHGRGLRARRARRASPTRRAPSRRAYLSLSSLDFNKWILSFGGSLYIGKHWRFDAVFAHVFAQSVYVNPEHGADPAHQPAAGQRAARGRERRAVRREREHHRRGAQLPILSGRGGRGSRGAFAAGAAVRDRCNDR